MHGSVDKCRSYPGRGDFFLPCPVPHCHGVILIVLNWCKVFSLVSLMKTNTKYSVTKSPRLLNTYVASENGLCLSLVLDLPRRIVGLQVPQFSSLFITQSFQILIISQCTNTLLRVHLSSSVFRGQINMYLDRPYTEQITTTDPLFIRQSTNAKPGLKFNWRLKFLWKCFMPTDNK